MQTNLSYLALGDSCTVGESVIKSASFPYQLVKYLNEQNFLVNNPKVIAQSGWTTKELIAALATENTTETFDLVTILIGVSNQFKGLSKEEYREDFVEILTKAIAMAGGKPEHVYVLSLPDWGITDFAKAQGKNAKIIAEEIDAFNKINREEAMYKQVGYIDITSISRTAVTKPSLYTAADGLHPSEAMYSAWALHIANEIVRTKVY